MISTYILGGEDTLRGSGRVAHTAVCWLITQSLRETAAMRCDGEDCSFAQIFYIREYSNRQPGFFNIMHGHAYSSIEFRTVA